MLDLQAYLNRLASDLPAPGGGSASTLVGAFGAALVAMVARITLGNPKHAAVAPDALALVQDADALRARFTGAREIDENAYLAVVAAQALPRADDAQRTARTAQLQRALAAAAQAPLEVAELAGMLFALCERSAALGNTHLMSDVACAAAFARAALDASAANVAINHRYLKDAATVETQARRLAAVCDAASASEARVRDRIAAAA